jgi:hypothetical protein
MSDEIVVAYRLDIEKSQENLERYEKTLLEADAIAKKSTREGSKAYSDQTKQVKKLSDATEGQTKKVSALSDKLKDIAGQLPFAGQIQQVTQLGSAITGLGGAAQTSTGGFKALKIAIIGTGIGALVIAIIGLISYFKRTDEGATRLAGIMGALGAATDLVTGIVIGLGEAVFDSFTSIDNFKKGLSDLGDFIVNNLLNRLKAPIVAFEALQLAIGGNFEAAGKRFIDATTQMATGITDITKKTEGFIDRATEAAAAAFEWEQRMDTLQDKIREESKLLAQNDAAITKLVIASRNKNIEDEKSLEFLDQATKLEKQNLAITLANEKEKLKLIQERNQRERESINQEKKNLTDELVALETSASRKKAILKELRSINDDSAQEEVDQINKITAIQQASDNLLEKVNNRRDAKLEEIFQNQVKRISQQEVLQENVAKANFLAGVTSAEELEQELYNIKLKGLIDQKELLVKESRDVVDIDKAILDLQLANLDKQSKEAAAIKKKANDDFLASLEERLKEEERLSDERRKKEEEQEKEQQKKIGAIKETGFAIANELATGFADIAAQNRQTDLDQELNNSRLETERKQEDLQTQLDNGVISQDQFNQRKIALEKKQSEKEAEIKRKQFEANKKAALIQVAIDTATSIVKAFAQLGPIGGVLGAALAAAAGLAQAAVISAQPAPKFEKGGKVKGNRHSKGGTMIEAEDGEWVVNRRQSSRHDKLIENINNGTADKYINSAFVVPAIHRHENEVRAKNRERAKRESRNREVNNFDTSKIESYLRKNNSVSIKNISDLAGAVARERYFNSKLFS